MPHYSLLRRYDTHLLSMSILTRARDVGGAMCSMDRTPLICTCMCGFVFGQKKQKKTNHARTYFPMPPPILVFPPRPSSLFAKQQQQQQQLKSAALAVEKGGEMKPAGMGRGDGVWHGQKSRGDSILWITEGLRGTGEVPEVCFTLPQPTRYPSGRESCIILHRICMYDIYVHL